MHFHWGPSTRRQGTPKLCPWSSTSPVRAPRERAAGRWQRNTLSPSGISVPNPREPGWALGTPLVAQVDGRACVPTAASEPLSQGRARMETLRRARCPLPPCLGRSRQLPWGTRKNQKEKCLVQRRADWAKHLLMGHRTSPNPTSYNLGKGLRAEEYGALL